jgi:hypothetical protein
VKRLAASLGIALLALGAGTARAETPPPRVTLISDSVGGGAIFSYDDARATLGSGIDLQNEWRSCRKLVEIGCVQPTGAPPSALDTIESLGPELGPIVVVDVGYNDLSDGYGDGLDAVMGALLASGVRRVVWVTLEETIPAWIAINAQIRAASVRWPALTVADWASAVAGKPWLYDGAHMNHNGARGFARFLRPYVLEAIAGLSAHRVELAA